MTTIHLLIVLLPAVLVLLRTIHVGTTTHTIVSTADAYAFGWHATIARTTRGKQWDTTGRNVDYFDYSHSHVGAITALHAADDATTLHATTTTAKPTTSTTIASLSSSLSLSRRKEIEAYLQQQHDSEIANSRSMYGDFSSISISSTSSNTGTPTSPTTPTSTWTDDDFIVRSVGRGNAGPDEQAGEGVYLNKNVQGNGNGHCIYQTKAPVFTKEECNALVEEARSTITTDASLALTEAETDTENNNNISNSELGEARVSTLAKAKSFLQTAMQHKLLPLLESRFGVSATSDLTLQDALIIGYGMFGDGTQSTQAQPLHRDSCLLSLNVALSPSSDYKGGGTYFQALGGDVDDNSDATGTPKGGQVVHNEQGHVICHASGAMHAGQGIDAGERWVLVLFVLAAKNPQLARRCDFHGHQILRAQGALGAHQGPANNNHVQEAFDIFQTGLQVAPRDHLLHMGMGRAYAAAASSYASPSQSQPSNTQVQAQVQSRHELAKAHFFYKPSHEASLALGTMLLEQQSQQRGSDSNSDKRRPRAALRWLELCLERIGTSDLNTVNVNVNDDMWKPLKFAGWDARVKAAQAAIMCASRLQQQQAQQQQQRIRGLALSSSSSASSSTTVLDEEETIDDINITTNIQQQQEQYHLLLGKALTWIDIAMQAAPDHPMLYGMKNVATDMQMQISEGMPMSLQSEDESS
jgi:hypothetical protein